MLAEDVSRLVLIFWGIRGSGHGLVVRLKGLCSEVTLPKG